MDVKQGGAIKGFEWRFAHKGEAIVCLNNGAVSPNDCINTPSYHHHCIYKSIHDRFYYGPGDKYNANKVDASHADVITWALRVKSGKVEYVRDGVVIHTANAKFPLFAEAEFANNGAITNSYLIGSTGSPAKCTCRCPSVCEMTFEPCAVSIIINVAFGYKLNHMRMF